MDDRGSSGLSRMRDRRSRVWLTMRISRKYSFGLSILPPDDSHASSGPAPSSCPAAESQLAAIHAIGAYLQGNTASRHDIRCRGADLCPDDRVLFLQGYARSCCCTRLSRTWHVPFYGSDFAG